MDTLRAEIVDEEEESEDHAHSFRFSNAELQQLRCPANSDPGLKLKFFHLEIVRLKSMANAEAQALLQQGVHLVHGCHNTARGLALATTS